MNKAAFWNSEVKQVHKVRQNTGFFFQSFLNQIKLFRQEYHCHHPPRVLRTSLHYTCILKLKNL